jgi:protein-S-isoprenylcysteine O-methyltransferase Ste14
MIRLGNFFFRNRSFVFPAVFVLMLIEGTWPVSHDERVQTIMLIGGLIMALAGQSLRAVTIGLAYIKRGGKDKQVYASTLVTQGLFAHCRNPLYVGNILIVSGVGIASNSMPFVLLGIPFFLFLYFAIVMAEENYLRGKFGQEFEDYCRRVRRFVPRLTGIADTVRGMEFHWRRLIAKEYQTPFIWLTGMSLLVMKRNYLLHGYDASKQTLWALFAWILVLAAACFAAWYLKKSKFLRPD